jgi:hypothetical protein
MTLEWTKEHDVQVLDAILEHARDLKRREIRGQLAQVRMSIGLLQTRRRDLMRQLKELSPSEVSDA